MRINVVNVVLLCFYALLLESKCRFSADIILLFAYVFLVGKRKNRITESKRTKGVTRTAMSWQCFITNRACFKNSKILLSTRWRYYCFRFFKTVLRTNKQNFQFRQQRPSTWPLLYNCRNRFGVRRFFDGKAISFSRLPSPYCRVCKK